MPSEIDHVPASFDFTEIPPGQEGKCVVFLSSTKKPIGYGDTIDEALADAGRAKDDQTIVIVRVPERVAVF